MESEAVLHSQAPTEGGRVQAKVALALLRALQDQDRPGEVLDNESVGTTLPRRFGLTDVVASQIRRYEREARMRGRISEAEVRDLIRLLIRRPDSESLFRRAGRSLAPAGAGAAWRKLLPRGTAFALVRSAVARRLRSLLGSPAVRVAGAPFEIEITSDVLVGGNAGEACGLVTGFARAMIERFLRDSFEVSHAECRARGDGRCLWRATEAGPRDSGPGDSANRASGGAA